jgi:hypothetical protein
MSTLAIANSELLPIHSIFRSVCLEKAVAWAQFGILSIYLCVDGRIPRTLSDSLLGTYPRSLRFSNYDLLRRTITWRPYALISLSLSLSLFLSFISIYWLFIPLVFILFNVYSIFKEILVDRDNQLIENQANDFKKLLDFLAWKYIYIYIHCIWIWICLICFLNYSQMVVVKNILE